MKKMLILGLSLLGVALGQNDTFDPAQFERSLVYQTGLVSVLNQKVNIQVPVNMRFLDASNAQKLLEEGWGNPQDPDVLGMLVPARTSPMSNSGWGVVVTYEEDGHISDKDASTINYSQLLKDMQEASRSSNAERKEAGYPTVDLIGWATPPRYDGLSHKMYWAKEISFDSDPVHTLNYNVRVLGRTGVLNLNAVAGMNQISEVEAAIPEMLDAVSFTPGNRYEDFQAGRDKVAEYGLAALVAGGLGAAASKTGILAVILLFLKKFFVFILAGVAALFRAITGRRQQA